MFVIFPFEVEFYKKFGIEVEYLGNPTLDIVENKLFEPFTDKMFRNENSIGSKPVIALLPGSRIQEIEKILPEMVEVRKNFPDYEFLLAATKSVPIELYRKIILDIDIKIIIDKTYELLQIAEFAIVGSGTATLETALFNVPQIVCYKTSYLTYIIGKSVVNIDYFSLVNILLDKKAVAEFLQTNLTSNISEELNKIIKNAEYREKMLENYSKLYEQLGKIGSAERTAKRILEII